MNYVQICASLCELAQNTRLHLHFCIHQAQERAFFLDTTATPPTSYVLLETSLNIRSKASIFVGEHLMRRDCSTAKERVSFGDGACDDYNNKIRGGKYWELMKD
jgi:hypothetical protein